MAFRRYLFGVDTSQPFAAMDRYIAGGADTYAPSDLSSIERTVATYRQRAQEQTASGWSPTPGGWNVDWNAVLEQAENYLAQRRDLDTRRATTDLFSPAAWAVVDANDFAAATPATMPERMRAFLAAPHRSTDQFIQFADREVALAALARARSVSPAQIAAMPTAEAQSFAVTEMWRNFAAYFRALNLRPWGWSKYRARLISCWGIGQWGEGRGDLGNGVLAQVRNEVAQYPGMVAGGLSFGRATPTTNESSAYYNSIVRGPEGYDRLVTGRRPIPRDTFGGIGGPGSPTTRTVSGLPAAQSVQPNDWRTEAFVRCKQFFSDALIAGSTPSRVRFGTPEAVSRSRSRGTATGREESPGCTGLDLDIDGTDCLGPSGDVFRVWLTNGARLGNGNNYDPACFTTRSCFAHIDCVRRSLANGLTTGPNPIGGPAGPNWLCGGADYDSSWLYYLPPDLWYALFLWPMIEYLATRDPLEIIYEVYLDVSGKNLWTGFASSNGASMIEGLGVARAAATGGISANQALAGLQSAASLAGAIGGTASPMFGAVAGVAGSGANLLRQLIPAPEAGVLDEVGRHEPALEYLSIVPNSRENNRRTVAAQLGIDGSPDGAREPIVYHGAPPPTFAATQTTTSASTASRPPVRSAYIVSGSMLAPTSGTSTTRQIVETGDSTLRIHAMPPYGAVFIDDEDVPAIGAWEDDNAQEFWSVPIRPGPHRIRVAAPVLPDGSPSAPDRFASVVQIPKEPLTIDYATMPTAAQLANPPSQGMSGAAKAGVAVGAGAIVVGLAYVFRRELGFSRKKT